MLGNWARCQKYQHSATPPMIARTKARIVRRLSGSASRPLNRLWVVALSRIIELPGGASVRLVWHVATPGAAVLTTHHLAAAWQKKSCHYLRGSKTPIRGRSVV